NLKENFLETIQEELITENQLFLNNSVESFFMKDFERLFLNNEEVTINQRIELPAKHTIEEAKLHMLVKLRRPYISLAIIYAMEYQEANSKFPSHKVLRGLIDKKIQELFGISNQHERRYWAE
ncbi:16247_t:CDS:2, partial [Dentiscutata erythropus]